MATPAKGKSPSKRSILIADDDPSIRSLLRTLFEGEGYRIHEVTTGREVLPAVHKNRPDLVVMDIRMPGV